MLLAGLTTLDAQRVYFCDNYTATGEPIGANTKVLCPEEGGYIYILYQNGMGKLLSGDYFIYVDKLSGDSYIPFDVKSISSDVSQNWFVFDYKFLTAGDYRITIKNPAQVEVAKDYLQLVEDNSTGGSSTDIYDDPTSTFYYTYSNVEATTSITASTGDIPAAYTSFNIDPSLGGRIYFKVSNSGQAIGTDEFIVFIDKKDAEGNSEIYDNKIFTLLDKNKTWDQFYVDFYSPGEYIVTVYSDFMVFINTVTITLINKV
jgi:hypothetical protein